MIDLTQLTGGPWPEAVRQVGLQVAPGVIVLSYIDPDIETGHGAGTPRIFLSADYDQTTLERIGPAELVLKNGDGIVVDHISMRSGNVAQYADEAIRDHGIGNING